jgi:hypothetical protein
MPSSCQSFNAAVLAHESINLLKYHLSAALIFAAQGVELRAKERFGTSLGGRVLSRLSSRLYDTIYTVVGRTPSSTCTLVIDDAECPIDQSLHRLFTDLTDSDSVIFRSARETRYYSS